MPETPVNEILTEKTGKIEKFSGLPLYRVLNSIWFETKFGIIVVKRGFETDYASIPKWARWLYKVNDNHYKRGAILHDFLFQYRGGEKIKNWNLKEL